MRFVILLVVTSASSLRTYQADYEANYRAYSDDMSKYRNFDYEQNDYAQYDEVSQRQVLWVASMEDVISTSVYKDYGVNNLFDSDNDTFWLSDFGHDIISSSIELGNFITITLLMVRSSRTLVL